MAIIIPALPYTLTNGTTADANQVMADLNDIVSGVNTNGAHNGPNSDITSLTGLTTPLAANQGGTGIAAPGSANNILQSNGSGLWQATPLLGVTDGSNAAAGQVGEYLSTIGSITALTTNINSNVAGATLSLPAGDWSVWGSCQFVPSASAIVFALGLSTVSATLPSAGPSGQQVNLSMTGLNTCMLVTAVTRFSSSTTTTIYLVVQANFPSGTCTAQGNIQARRVR
jgi:hypothetical protein